MPGRPPSRSDHGRPRRAPRWGRSVRRAGAPRWPRQRGSRRPRRVRWQPAPCPAGWPRRARRAGAARAAAAGHDQHAADDGLPARSRVDVADARRMVARTPMAKLRPSSSTSALPRAVPATIEPSRGAQKPSVSAQVGRPRRTPTHSRKAADDDLHTQRHRRIPGPLGRVRQHHADTQIDHRAQVGAGVDDDVTPSDSKSAQPATFL